MTDEIRNSSAGSEIPEGFVSVELLQIERNTADRLREENAKLRALAPAQSVSLTDGEGKAKAALAYLLDHIVYSDSYGVQGSEFTCCHLCHGGGAPQIAFNHDKDCPAFKCESIAEEWWKETREEVQELEKEIAELKATPPQRAEND